MNEKVQSYVKVIQLATGHEGGAGLAARRLNQHLISNGISSTFLALDQVTYKPSLNEFTLDRTVWKRFLSGIVLRLESKFTSKILFSSCSISAKKLKYFKRLSSNKSVVLHFHNWYNLISQNDLLALIHEGFPVCITLHDERIITGGCHYKLDCSRFALECTKCPRAAFPIKRRIHSNYLSIRQQLDKDIKNFVLVTPSNWLRTEALVALGLNSDQILHIPNSLGREWNRSGYNYAPGAAKVIFIGIASMNTLSYLKGGDIVEQLLTDNDLKEKQIVFLLLNKIPEGDEQFREFWSKIDFLLVISRADNSPNVIHEAKSMGIPVIASEVGGIGELLAAGYDIRILEKNNNFQFIKRLLSEVRKVDPVQQIFMKVQFDNYIGQSFVPLYEVYKKILDYSKP